MSQQINPLFILENGESLEITDEEARKLELADMIYYCPEMECSCYHISHGKSWTDVEQFIKEAG